MPGRATPAMEALRGFAQTLSEAEAQSRAALTTGADPHDLVAAIAESQLAVDTVVTLRNKAVEAYQEILRMPV
nr:flagellar hook-basal body complex protein FliE [Jannaschia formosa]